MARGHTSARSRAIAVFACFSVVILAALARGQQYLVNTQQVTFAPLYNGPDGVMGDFEGNGFPDVVHYDHFSTQFAYRANPGINGIGALVNYYWSPAVGGPPGVGIAETGDFDGDGSLDLGMTIEVNGGATSVFHWFRGDGTGAFNLPPFTPLGLPDARLFRVVDLDRDGRSDLVLTRYSTTASPISYRISIMHNAPSGWIMTWDAPMPRLPTRVRSGDFDGDGNVDLAWSLGAAPVSGGTGTYFTVAYGNGNGTIQPPIQVPLGAPMPNASGGYGAYLEVGDLDLDGRDDVLEHVWYDELRVYYGNANRTFTPAASWLTVITPAFAAFGLHLSIVDITADGVPDILFEDAVWSSPAQQHTYPRLRLVVGLGNRQFSPQIMTTNLAPPLLNEGFNPLVGDFDGDGDLDVFGACRGYYDFYFQNRAIASSGCAGSLGTPPASWTAVSAVGNTSFATGIYNLLPNSAVVLGIATSTLPAPILPSGLLLDVASTNLWFPMTADALGQAAIAIPIPPLPTLHGATFFTQWAAVDPFGQPFGSLNLVLSPARTIIVW